MGSLQQRRIARGKNTKYQQNLAGRKIAIAVLGRQQWPESKPHVQLVVATVNAANPAATPEQRRGIRRCKKVVPGIASILSI
jgi:hypothetical protein